MVADPGSTTQPPRLRPLRPGVGDARVLLSVLLTAASAHAAPKTTYSIDYVVTISRHDPTRAHVRWFLTGIDEITAFRLVFRDSRTTDVSGSGTLVWHGRTLTWTPGAPYAHLAYTVTINHHRPPGPRFDGYATPDWVAVRAFHLFPEINVHFRGGADQARSRARLVFHLPPGWRSVTALRALGDDTFALEEPGKRLDRPRGWFLLGNVDRYQRLVAGMDITVATAPGSALDARRLLRLYARTVPLLAGILGPPPKRLLVVSAPDPMWHGGLSGEDSFFVNGHIPLRSADKTSSYLHELFHVWQPFRPAEDGRWVAEGFAEYYSLVLQHRAGRLSERSYARGLALFTRYGHWGADLTRTHDPAALNNNAPAVMALIDAEIRRTTNGRRSLDDAVESLAGAGGVLSTASFLRAVNRAAGRDFTPLFRRHVYRGEAPPGQQSGNASVLPTWGASAT